MKIQGVSGETLQLAEVEVYGPDVPPGINHLDRKMLSCLNLSAIKHSHFSVFIRFRRICHSYR